MHSRSHTYRHTPTYPHTNTHLDTHIILVILCGWLGSKQRVTKPTNTVSQNITSTGCTLSQVKYYTQGTPSSPLTGTTSYRTIPIPFYLTREPRPYNKEIRPSLSAQRGCKRGHSKLKTASSQPPADLSITS